MASDLVFNVKTQPAKLPKGNITETSAVLNKHTESRIECKAYGWGHAIPRSFNGLKVVRLHLVKTYVCQRILAKKRCKIYFCIYIILI